MKLHNTVVSIIRLYGIYLLVHIPMTILGVLSVFYMDNEQFVRNMPLYQATSVATPFVYILVAVFLFKKADTIAQFVIGKNKDENIASEGSYLRLSFWITLLGIYFFITSTEDLIRNITRESHYTGDWFFWSNIISNSFTLFIAWLFTFRSKAVEEYIMKKSRDKSQQINPADPAQAPGS